jgi:hypothetical protein
VHSQKLGKVAVGFVMSLRAQETTWLPLEGFLYFAELCPENSSLINPYRANVKKMVDSCQ